MKGFRNGLLGPKLLGVATLLSSLSASAAVSSAQTVPASPANVSTASATIEGSGFKRLPISISATSMLYGPAVSKLGSGSTTAYTAGDVWGLSAENQIAMKYRLSDSMTITPVFDFVYQFTDPLNGGADRRASLMYDSYIKLSRYGIASASLAGNDLAIDSEMRLYVPSSESSRDNGTLGGVRLAINPSLQFAKSRWSLSSVNHVRYWIQTRDTSASGSNLPRIQLYTGPQMNYKVSDAVTAWVLYEATVIFDIAGIPNSRNPKRSLADIEPGIDVKVNDRVSLTPYLNWYTSQPIKTTSVNLTANFTVL